MKHVTPPSVRETAFNCPHCYAFAHQSWYSIGAKMKDESQLPPIVKGSDVASMQNNIMRRELDGEGRATDAENLKWAGLMVTGNPFLWPEDALFCDFALCNVSLSECFNCKNVSFWIYDRLVYPRTGKTLPANPDLPEEIRADYDEASKILDESPRGAAALMHPREDRPVRLDGDPPPRPRHRRLIRGRFVQPDVQELPQAQRIGCAPRHRPFRLQAFEVAEQQHPEVATRRERGPADSVGVELRPLLLDESIEAASSSTRFRRS